jgi:REP element-mobilizing transposase RayT
MPRQARKKSKSGIYHIMMRGINRQNIFQDDDDKNKFLQTIRKYKRISNYELYSYCLMNNHVHMLVKETSEPISDLIKRISSSYVLWYNKKHERCGHLFQERYKSETVENEEYFLTVLRYIHQNPVKAKLSKNVEGYKWSSYNEYIQNSKKTEITDIDFALEILSADRNKALELFIKYTKEQNEDKCLDIEEKLWVSDDEVRGFLRRYNVFNKNDLNKMDKDKRNKIISEIKSIKGVTVRQLSRLTGISKSVIDRTEGQ